MTTTFDTDDNNDLFIGVGGSLVVVSGLPAVEAACETATKAQLGEMVLTTQQGIPNFQAVWIGAPNFPLFESFLRTTLENVPGVVEVTSLRLLNQNSTLNYIANITTEFGELTING